MSNPLRIAVAGVGRMGAIHALHLHQIAEETGACTFAAIADADTARASRVASELGLYLPVFSSVAELAGAGVCDAVVVVTPTDNHREHATALIAKGYRVMLEKPLTGTLEGDAEFSAELDRVSPNGVMLAFQRRFDAPLQYAKELMDSGLIGPVFKIYSALEDSSPAPDGYRSGGILPDMSVHNVDEILWLSGQTPRASLAVGSRIYSHALTTCDEDFDDALLCVWFENGLLAQIQVSRNHVSGYRVETAIFGEKGQIRIGRFDGRPRDVIVEAYGKRGQTEPLAYRTFSMPDYGKPLPEFVDRFGPAYKIELATFIECCRANTPFPSSHRDGLRAQQVISAGMKAVFTVDQAAPVRDSAATA